MSIDWYILDEQHNVVRCTTVSQWSEWIEENPRRRIVKRAHIDCWMVSTVFLGLDHNHDPNSHMPVVFETMIFYVEVGREYYCDRYSTWQEAIDGHNRIVRRMRKGDFTMIEGFDWPNFP